MQPELTTPPPPFLLVAASGRQLAQSARRGGHAALVIDWFADRDCCDAAREVRRALAADALRFDADALLTAAGDWAAACAGIVVGSGLEDAPGLLARLADAGRLYGNDPATVAAAKDPAQLFPLLTRLGIPHPEVRLAPPAHPAGWLVKRVGGAGGGHVQPASAAQAPTPAGHFYWQRLHPGRSLSLLFLADGSSAWIVGCSEQILAPTASAPYRYGGCIGALRLPAALRGELQAQLDALVAALGLRGLNGVDFLLDACCHSVIEVNPRPTAALDCYDADFAHGLFDLHLRACGGDLPDFEPQAGVCRGHLIHYAEHALVLDRATRLPSWCSDLPRAGSRFAAGDPVCTIHGAAPTPGRTRSLLARRHGALRHLLEQTS